MSAPFTPDILSSQLDDDLIWRRKELSDLKSAAVGADRSSRSVLLRSVITIAYAHWEGFVCFAASKYFKHLTLKKKPYADLDEQFYKNHFLHRFDDFFRARATVEERCVFLGEVISLRTKAFVGTHTKLINAQSNLNSERMAEICLICGIDGRHFEANRIFIDTTLLKRRNAIAHGQAESVGLEEIDEIIRKVLSLMTHFRDLLENRIYTQAYLLRSQKPTPLPPE